MTTFTDHNGDPIVTPCAQTDPELFFSTAEGDEARAKRICATCPAVAQCLEFAQSVEKEHGYGYKHGVWAGRNPAQRSRLEDKKAVA